MGSKSHQVPNAKSLLYRDLASPISSSHRSSRFATPRQAAAVSALWRENISASSDNPPPPPIFTLEDRIDFSPEPALNEIAASPESFPDPKTPTPVRNYHSTPSPVVEKSAGSGSRWGPPAGSEEEGKGSPADGVVKMGVLVTVPPPREVVRPELKRSQVLSARDGLMDEEEWVTVYGFSPGDTNLVLREFENCGVILKHIPGPWDANWIHILYQNRYDAQKALGKNGMQLNSVLIIGVKPIDPVQRQFLNERLNSNTCHGGFLVSLPPQFTSVKSTSQAWMAAPPRPQFLQNGGTMTNVARHSTGAIASPAKSVVSKVMDWMFGF